MSHIGLWFYRNEGGDFILQKIKAQLKNLNHAVFDSFDMRECYVSSGRVYTRDGFDLSSLDFLYYMNADEQTNHQREILRIIELSGVPIINSFSSFDNCQDKFIANFLLRQSGINVPPAMLIPTNVTFEFVKEIFNEWEALVLKPRRSHGGKGIQKFESAERFFDFISSVEGFYDNFYIEKFISFGEKDFRVDLINGEVVGGYSRKKNHSFKTNVHENAEMLPIPPTEDRIAYAKKASEILGITCTIIDMLISEDDGKLYIIEVNPLLGVFTEIGLIVGVNTIQSAKDIHPIFAYDDKKIKMLVNYLDHYAQCLCKKSELT